MEGFPKSGFRQLSHHLSPKLSGFGVREVYLSVKHAEELDLSRFSAAARARLSHLSFESDRAFPAQC